MKVSTSHRVDVARDRLWAALADPEVLARTVPGCRAVARTGPDTAVATVELRAGGVRGTYRLEARVVDRSAPEHGRLEIDGAGTEGPLRGDLDVRLEDDGAATVVHVDLEAEVGGTLGAVGGRLLAAVAERAATDLLDALAAELAAPTPAAPDQEEPLVLAPEALAATAPPVDGHTVVGGVPAGRRLAGTLAALTGAVTAVVALLLGWRRRRRAREGPEDA